jgi:hypothetical protein
MVKLVKDKLQKTSSIEQYKDEERSVLQKEFLLKIE